MALALHTSDPAPQSPRGRAERQAAEAGPRRGSPPCTAGWRTGCRTPRRRRRCPGCRWTSPGPRAPRSVGHPALRPPSRAEGLLDRTQFGRPGPTHNSQTYLRCDENFEQCLCSWRSSGAVGHRLPGFVLRSPEGSPPQPSHPGIGLETPLLLTKEACPSPQKVQHFSREFRPHMKCWNEGQMAPALLQTPPNPPIESQQIPRQESPQMASAQLLGDQRSSGQRWGVGRPGPAQNMELAAAPPSSMPPMLQKSSPNIPTISGPPQRGWGPADGRGRPVLESITNPVKFHWAWFGHDHEVRLTFRGGRNSDHWGQIFQKQCIWTVFHNNTEFYRNSGAMCHCGHFQLEPKKNSQSPPGGGGAQTTQ